VIVNGLFYALLAIIVEVAILPDPPRA